MSENAKAILRGIAYLIMNILLIVIAFYALNIIELEGRTTTISLPITISKSWLFSVPILTSSILSLITCIYLMIAEIRAVILGNVSGPIIVIPND
jgi:TRAP-type C4-dicarboxylate transport system permease small subunit